MLNRVLLAIVLLVVPSFGAAQKKSAKKPAARSSKKKSSATKKKKTAPKVSHARIRRMQRAFVASNELKPMARQLLNTRSRAAFAGVEAYARRHAGTDTGALADLALGYAHILDHDPAAAIAPLRQARSHAGDLADYVTYYLGSAYQASGNSEDAIAVLQDFSAKHQDSLFQRDATLVYANALVNTGKPELAVAVLQKNRLPTRADVEFALGQAQFKAGDTEKAADTLRHIYFSMPLSPEADKSAALLRSLPGGTGETFALAKSRADLLARGRHYSDATDEYRQLVDLASAQDRPEVEVELGGVLHKAGKDTEARKLLEKTSPSGESNAERLFYLLEIARSDADDDRFLGLLDDLRKSAPNSSWLEQALLTAGNVYLLRNDYDRAIDFYREIRERFPRGRLAPYANWKAAWLSLRQNRVEDARQGFERQLLSYPDSQQVAAAIYWRARLAEEQEHDAARAHALYAKLADRFRNYYYADLARERLTGIRNAGLSDPLLSKIPPLDAKVTLTEGPPPADNLRLQKARLLHNGGMTDLAVRELRAAGAEGGSHWTVGEIARLYKDNGEYHRALQYLKQVVPSYFAMDMDDLPRPYWEDLFPRAYWPNLKRFSVANGLDPFLVASLIRQESEFNPNALSRANAWGLMQVLPATGRKLAHALHVRGFNNQSLLVPEINMELGTRYFRELVDHFNGQVEYALAAYNAGTSRVDDWLASGNFPDTHEFVESIPFTETREYVQSILRNASVYRKLYGQP